MPWLNLPEEILVHILGLEILPTTRLVCRKWRDALDKLVVTIRPKSFKCRETDEVVFPRIGAFPNVHSIEFTRWTGPVGAQQVITLYTLKYTLSDMKTENAG